MEDIVNLLLDVGYQIYVAHDRDLEDFLSTMNNDGEHEAVVRVQALLIEK